MPAEPPVDRPSPFRRSIIRCLSALIAGGLVAAAPAGADTREASSPVTGMRASLIGAQLTVAPGPSPSAAFLRSVQGRAVTVACSSGAAALVAAVEEGSAVPTGSFDASFLGGPAPWTAGSSSMTHGLARDVSATVDGCIVGRAPAIASAFAFNALGRSVLDDAIDEQRLALAHHAAKFAARDRHDSRFPSARRLAAEIAESEPQMDVAFSRTVRHATRNDIVYVIGRRTSFKRVSLAYRQNDGQAVRLEGRRRGEATIILPEDADVPVPTRDDVSGRFASVR